MTAIDRVARIIDLFSEGTEVLLGFDGLDPVVVWVNKMNAFETQEARADGNARRSERMYQLGKADSPEKLGYEAEIAGMSHEVLAKRLVDSRADEIYLDVINDIEVDPDWRERRDRIERLPVLLADSNAAEDDPRRAQLQEDQMAWMQAISEGQAKRNKDALAEAVALSEEDLRASLWERYRQRQTLDVFVQERRTTQLYLCLRECRATDVGPGPGQHRWDHENCNHNARLLAKRADVKNLPDSVIEKCSAALDEITINPRAAGNSDAPASSSASSEPASASEAASSPSTQEATPPVRPSS